MFDQMVTQLTIDAFKDVDAKQIDKTEYDSFIKEFVFDKLRGINLGEAFAKKFNVRDRVLYMYRNEADTMKHIENWYVTK